MSWSQFAQEAPELAAAVRARFECHAHHVIATLRSDGSPRVSGTNVEFRDGEIYIGSMTGAVKADDLRRDPRFALHSATLDEQLIGGDAKLSGTAEPAGQIEDPDGDSFRLVLREASLVEVDDKELVITSWSAGSPARVRRRT